MLICFEEEVQQISNRQRVDLQPNEQGDFQDKHWQPAQQEAGEDKQRGQQAPLDPLAFPRRKPPQGAEQASVEERNGCQTQSRHCKQQVLVLVWGDPDEFAEVETIPVNVVFLQVAGNADEIREAAEKRKDPECSNLKE